MELIIGSDHMQDVADVTAEYPYALHPLVSSAETRVPWHWHEEVEFSLVRRGALQVTVAGRQQILSAGEGMFLNTNVLHAMAAADPAAETVWDSHMLHPVLLGGHYKSVFDSKYLSPVLKNKRCDLLVFRPDSDARRALLDLLAQAAAAQDRPDSEFRTRNIFSDIWLLLMEEAAAQTAPPPVSQERIQLMLTYIHQHFREKLTLDQIAAAAAVSQRECLRCFRSCIQTTPFTYLTDYRLQMAERLLRTTNLSVTEIALETGFSDGAYFSKLFRQARRLSPTQYRKGLRRRAGPEPGGSNPSDEKNSQLF